MKRRIRLLPVIVLLLSLLLASTALADSTYVVQPGDTLYRIAARFGTNVPTLVGMNNISNPNYIWVGQVLRVPGDGDTAPPAGDTPAPAPSTGGTYVVRAGDTLYRIAAQHGTNVVALAAANNLSNPNYIYVGQVLTIPGGTTGSTPPPSGSPPPPVTSGSFELGGQATGLGQAERMRMQV
jgi:LysM repeat protein